MLLNRSRGWLFLKTYKTASTTAQLVLSRVCDGDDDIVPPFPTRDEEEMRKRLGGACSKNWYYDERSTPLGKRLEQRGRIAGYALKLMAAGLFSPSRVTEETLNSYLFEINRCKTKRFWPHMPLGDVIDEIGMDSFDGLYSFGFVRHPFLRLVSQWMFANRARDLQALTVREAEAEVWNFSRTRRFVSSQSILTSSKHSREVSEVFRFEEIDDAFRRIADRIQEPPERFLPMPHMKHHGMHQRLSFDKKELHSDRIEETLRVHHAWEYGHYA